MGEPYNITMIKDYASGILGDLKAGEKFVASMGIARMLCDMGVAEVQSVLDDENCFDEDDPSVEDELEPDPEDAVEDEPEPDPEDDFDPE